MKNFKHSVFNILVAFILGSSLVHANESNISNSNDSNSTWHFALTGGYSSYSGVALGLYFEKDITKHSSILSSIAATFGGDNKFIENYSFKIRHVYYSDENAYLYEGLYLFYSLSGIRTESSIFNQTSFELQQALGYGWHFFDHSLVFTLDVYIAENYSMSSNMDMDMDIALGPIIYFNTGGALAYIF